MKRISLVLALAAAVSAQTFAQVPVPMPVSVLTAGIDFITTTQFVETALFYADSIKTQVENAMNTWNQLQTAYEQLKTAYKNLETINTVTDWKSGVDWYNQQLQLEKRADAAIQNISLKVGPGETPIKMIDLDRMLDGTYIEHIGDVFLEESNNIDAVTADGVPESQKMKYNALLHLGMTPANYTYLTAVEDMLKKTGKAIFSGSTRVNEDNIASAERAKKRDDEIMSEDSGQKQVALASKQTLDELNMAVRQGNYDAAKFREWLGWLYMEHTKPDQGVFIRSPPGKNLSFGEVIGDLTIESAE